MGAETLPAAYSAVRAMRTRRPSRALFWSVSGSIATTACTVRPASTSALPTWMPSAFSDHRIAVMPEACDVGADNGDVGGRPAGG